MDAYPLHYVQHNLPLVYLTGLSTPSLQDNVTAGSGPLIEAKLPLVQSDQRELLLQDFLSLQGTNRPSTASPNSSKNDLVGYKLRSVGRVRIGVQRQ
jgi:hypothetical protein